MFLHALLTSHGFVVLQAASATEAVREIATRNPDVVVLDLGLPDEDGLDVVTRVREWSQVPIIVVSARGLEVDKVRALDRGADDYLTKPFGAEELLARVRVALRHVALRGSAEEGPVYEIGDLVLDLVRRQAVLRGTPVDLTRTEYRLLTTLARHAGRVLTHQQILQEVWGQAYIRHIHYVRVFIAQLRRKLEDDPSRPSYILTETGVGYRFRDPSTWSS
ncbi:MAG: response regulator transcription factor [Myxococcota bacterium]